MDDDDVIDITPAPSAPAYVPMDAAAGEWGEGRRWTSSSWPDTLLAPAEYRGEDGEARLTEDAIALVESSGDPWAENPRSSARGLLQITDPLARDFGAPDSRAYLGPEGARLARLVFRRKMAALEDDHGWDPALMAIAWNRGGGGMRQTLRVAQAEGVSLPIALQRYVRALWMRRGASGAEADREAEHARRYVASVLTMRQQLRSRSRGPTGRPAPAPDPISPRSVTL